MLLSRWNACRGLPGGRWLFAKALGWLVPYVGPLGVEVEQISAGGARVGLRDRRSLRNHLGSIHAVALVNLAELTANLALTALQPKGARFIVTRVEADYTKKARGRVTCQVQLPHTDWQQLGSEAHATAEVTDAQGDLVCRVKVHWNLKS